MLLSELIKSVGCEIEKDIDISGISYDSRNTRKGDVFVCIKGYETNGHNYAKMAQEKGASAIVAMEAVDVSIPVISVPDTRIALSLMSARYFDNPSKKFGLIGVTGTNGKTTTTYLVKQILESLGYKVGLIGTNQNMIGKKIIPTSRTTPESYELQKLFFEMAKEKVNYVVMEVSSHSLALHRVFGCEFLVGAYTNITQDHLDFHHTMENYLEAKAMLFNMCKKAVINIDDEGGSKIIKTAQGKVITYSVSCKSDLHAENVVLRQDGVEFSSSYDGQKEKLHLGIPGMFSVYNALCSAGICLAVGVSLKDIKQALISARGVRGRAQVIPTGLDFTTLIDYAHSPDGLENIISTVQGFAKGRVIVLFGCGGDRDAIKRPIMGEIAARLGDFLVVTSDNPRTEDPMTIIDQILTGVKGRDCPYIVIENRREAIEFAMKEAKKDDVVILAGKGHETYQIIGHEQRHFDEEEIVIEIAKSMRG